MRAKNTISSVLKLITVVVVAFTMSSCFKEDTPIQLPPPGDAQFFQVGMGEDYHRQVYFDFNTADTLGSEHSTWDLCFESSETGWHVWMNGGNESEIANTDTQEFAAVTDTFGVHWNIDNPNWDIDSTAVGDWRVDRMVYILDRGPSKLAGDRYKKIIFQSANDTQYEIQYANLDGSSSTPIFYVPKKSGNAFVYFTFDNGGQTLDIEPGSTSWDALFTRYRVVFYDVYPALPYVVTGVLINPSIAVAVDSSMNFADINYQKALSLTFTSKRDIIGYSWKVYDFDHNAYQTKQYINYIIRDAEGVYWKLHFVDFYNSTGEKGYPQFEYQRL